MGAAPGGSPDITARATTIDHADRVRPGEDQGTVGQGHRTVGGEPMTAIETSRLVVPADLPTKLRHHIGGAWRDSVDGATFEVADPVSNQTYAHAAAGGPDDVALAVAAARAAFTDGPWPRMRN